MALERLRAALETGAATAASGSDVLDDPATGQALLTFLLRGVACGALSQKDLSSAGLSSDEAATGSFAAILAARRAR